MRFSESETMTVLTVAAKSFIREAARKHEHPIDVEGSWATMPEHGRQNTIEAVGRWVIPALDALPQIEVQAGKKPRFTAQQIGHAISDSALAAAKAEGFRLTLEEHAALVEQREMVLMSALAALPVSEHHIGKTTLDALLRGAGRFRASAPPEF